MHQLVEAGGGPCAEPGIGDPLVMSAMGVGRESGGTSAIPGPCTLGPGLSPTGSSHQKREEKGMDQIVSWSLQN